MLAAIQACKLADSVLSALPDSFYNIICAAIEERAKLGAFCIFPDDVFDSTYTQHGGVLWYRRLVDLTHCLTIEQRRVVWSAVDASLRKDGYTLYYNIGEEEHGKDFITRENSGLYKLVMIRWDESER